MAPVATVAAQGGPLSAVPLEPEDELVAVPLLAPPLLDAPLDAPDPPDPLVAPPVLVPAPDAFPLPLDELVEPGEPLLVEPVESLPDEAPAPEL